ncbi:MAG TPA: hypothetical protein VFU13_11595 [Steroidobacteraceae bacterium]|nr:hypothetical protein [Steroidobacteraceae bacterium]
MPINVHQQVRGGTCDDFRCRAEGAKRRISQLRATQEARRQSIARAHLQTLVTKGQAGAADVAMVVVSGSIASLQSVTSERRQRLRESVAEAVSASAEPEPGIAAEPLPPDDRASPSAAIASACAACRGSCCRGGGDTAYIDANTIRRVRSQRPELGPGELVALYENAVPGHGMDHSCIFHGDHGCALPRELRSNTCNTYFCPPMREWIGQPAATARPAVVVVLHEDVVVRSRRIRSGHQCG